MDRNEIENIVVNTLIQQFELSWTPGPNDSLQADFNDDRFVSMIMAFEETFDIEISDADAKQFYTVKDILNFLQNKLNIESRNIESTNEDEGSISVSSQTELLNKILEDSSKFLKASSGNVIHRNKKPILEFVFEPGKCYMLWKPGTYRVLENEEAARIFIDINEISVHESRYPHLRFMAYFPFSLKEDALSNQFLLKMLSSNKEAPFVELGIVLTKNNDSVLTFCCNRLFVNFDHGVPKAVFSEVMFPEVSFYIKSLLTSYEYALMEYESLISSCCGKERT